jgi:CubicO group peptidase (beta-lactamase class C family)
MTPRCILRLVAAGLLLTGAMPLSGRAAPPRPDWRPVAAVLEKAVADGTVVGAQLAIGDGTRLLLSRHWGKRAPGGPARVDEDTLFCIGSCSKPVAAACVLALVDEGTLRLEDRVGKWLPAFRRLEVEGGGAARRAPTVRELLAHRGGVYSQKDKLTREQNAAIRDFTLTLEESVERIGRQKLLSQPGARYAYSGAGYCVLGRAAELAAGKPFEELLQERLARPLGLRRTTYFPRPGDANVALPGKEAPRPPSALGARLRLPLIGGGLYSTAAETAAFARMVLNRGRARGKAVLSPAAWQKIVHRPFPGQEYGLGWGLSFGPNASGPARSLAHTGKLGGCESSLHIDLAGGHYMVAHWTRVDAGGAPSLYARLAGAWKKATGGAGRK